MEAVKSLPVAVIGAGPVGLAAAAHLEVRGNEAYQAYKFHHTFKYSRPSTNVPGVCNSRPGV